MTRRILCCVGLLSEELSPLCVVLFRRWRNFLKQTRVSRFCIEKSNFTFMQRWLNHFSLKSTGRVNNLKRTLFAENGACTFLLITHNHQMARVLSCSQPDGACLVSVDTCSYNSHKARFRHPSALFTKVSRSFKKSIRPAQQPMALRSRERTPRALDT